MVIELNKNDYETALRISNDIIGLFEEQPVRVALVSLEAALGAIVASSAKTSDDKRQAVELVQGIANNIIDKLK